MLALLQTLTGICIFQNGPQDLPYSPRALTALIAASATLTLVGATNLPEPEAVGRKVVVATAFSLAFLYSLLYLRGLRPRFVQSAMAWLGTDTILGLPMVALTLPIAAQGPEQAPGAATGILLLWGWQLLILGHILRHTLEIRWPSGVVLAMLHTFLSLGVVQLSAPS